MPEGKPKYQPESSLLRRMKTGLTLGVALCASEVGAQAVKPDKASIETTVETVEEEFNLEIPIQQAKDLMKEDLLREIAKGGVNYVNLDHALLAFGDEPIIEGKSLLDLGAGPKVDPNSRSTRAEFSGFQSAHMGSVEYSIVRTGIPWDKIMKVENGKNVSVKNWLMTAIKRLGRGYSHDYEWALLLAVELKKRGIDIPMKNEKGATVSMSELVRFNQEEMEATYNPTKLTPALKQEFFFGGTCESTHAQHALMAYALFSKDSQKVNSLLDLTFGQIKLLTSAPLDNDNFSMIGELMHKLSHQITVLTELPADYPLTNEQKKLLKHGVNQLQRSVARYKELYDTRELRGKKTSTEIDFDSGGLSHVIDALEHLPKELYTKK